MAVPSKGDKRAGRAVPRAPIVAPPGRSYALPILRRPRHVGKMGGLCNRGTHIYSPAAARRTYHSSKRAAELRYVSPDSRSLYLTRPIVGPPDRSYAPRILRRSRHVGKMGGL